ncbi:unnamed protein product [Cylicocyclus nassatus]|uniref:Uncharacterized protein n=1 Tax=Cylicocyclus nassatus TaxID=53992 RepID=A0AA36GGQ7_CYLNA|nr:unnamed protein product [Cylicocyclus nassatus]
MQRKHLYLVQCRCQQNLFEEMTEPFVRGPCYPPRSRSLGRTSALAVTSTTSSSSSSSSTASSSSNQHPQHHRLRWHPQHQDFLISARPLSQS